MKNIRWYDKNPDLKELFEFIEKCSDENKRLIAHDVVQVLITDFNLNLDETINNITKNYTYQPKRWYDENIDLFSAFEIIKGFELQQQEQIIDKIIQTILIMYEEIK